MNEEHVQELNQLEEIEMYARDYIIVTVIYLSVPTDKKMLSEELGDKNVSADILTTGRKKFFEWGDIIAVGKIIPNEAREMDVMVIEILTTKVTLS